MKVGVALLASLVVMVVMTTMPRFAHARDLGDAWKRCPPAADPTAAAPAPRTVRDVDWCNRDYPRLMSPLRAGVAELHEYAELGGPHDTTIWRLLRVLYADLDGDGAAEAIVVIDEDNAVPTAGGTRFHSRVHILAFAVRAGAVVSLGGVTLDPPVTRVTINRRHVVVTSGQGKARRRDRYALTGDALGRVGKP